MCTNGVPFVVAYLALLGIGAVAVPLNPTSPAGELARQVAIVRPSRPLSTGPGRAAWRDVRFGPVAAHGHRRRRRKIPGAIDADEMAAEPAPMLDVDPDHLAALLFTSGTAGAPKAAMLTHGSMRANLDQARSGREHLSPGTSPTA